MRDPNTPPPNAPRPRCDRASVLVAALLVLLHTFASPASAQPVGAGSTSGHVWLVLPDTESGGAVLVHAPPRHADNTARYRASEPGTLRVVRRLTFMPVGIAAGGDTVTLISAAATSGQSAESPAAPRGFALEATPTPMSDFWAYEPGGRFLPVQPLPEGLEVRGVSAYDDAPVLLGRLDGRWWLARLGANAWNPITLPEDAEDADTLVLTAATGDGLGIVETGSAGIWRAWAWRGEAAGDGRAWQLSALTTRRSLGDGKIFRLGRRWLAVRSMPGGIEITTLDESDERSLASVAQAPKGAVIGVTSDFGGRLVAVWTREPGPGATSDDDVEIAEVSLATGDVLYRGDPIRVSPISATQFRMLAAALVALAVIALLIVLGPGETPAVLPEGASLAEPGRRLIATLIDLAIAAGVCSVIFQIPVLDLLTFGVLFNGDGSWVALPATLGVGAAIGIVLEWLIGCSLGKAVLGCRVVSVRAPDAERAKANGRPMARALLWQVTVRNVIKWALPPVAALALLDSSARHRGDVLSRTAVVVPSPPPEPESE
ncbi:MAG: RDD family protein [Phycisphaerales bacterium]